MGIIQQDTAILIWQCYREIMAAEKLLKDMEELKKKYPNDPHARYLKDAFGCAQDLQLGIPSGENSHRLFNVSSVLAKSVIVAHIANKKAELIKINEVARIEMKLT